MKRWILLGASTLVLLVVLAGAGSVALGLRIFLVSPQGESESAPVEFIVNEGESAKQVADALEGAGVVRPAWLFSRVLQFSGAQARLQAGEYRFERPLSPAEVMRLLETGQELSWPVTIREGLDLEETAELLSGKGLAPLDALLSAFRNPDLVADVDPEATDLEGYLYPETYRLPRQYPSEEIAEALVAAWRRDFAEKMADEIADSGLSPREIVTLASLVEKETGLAEERPRIAGVFLERLDRGMRLQCDPTVIYALKLEGRWDGNIRRRDLAWDHPYNTYTRRGLPPGPIASPGFDALKAVLEAERNGELFFVARGDGGHVFSKTLREHQRAVRTYLLHQRNARQGSR